MEAALVRREHDVVLAFLSVFELFPRNIGLHNSGLAALMRKMLLDVKLPPQVLERTGKLLEAWEKELPLVQVPQQLTDNLKDAAVSHFHIFALDPDQIVNDLDSLSSSRQGSQEAIASRIKWADENGKNLYETKMIESVKNRQEVPDRVKEAIPVLVKKTMFSDPTMTGILPQCMLLLCFLT